MEDVVVVFRAGVDLGDAIDNFAEGNAAAKITDGDGFFFDADLNLLAGAHDVFVDGIVDDFFEEDVTAVIVMGAIADAADVHAGAEADVFQRGERLDFALVIDVLFWFSHSELSKGLRALPILNRGVIAGDL